MKILIASDIHGSAKYCRLLLDAYEKENADRLFLLGDILYHGPRNDLPEEYDPKQVIALLNAKKEQIYAVRGNCDAEVDQLVLDFPILADYALIPAGERMVYATHGHVYNKEKLPPMKPGDILLCGHTHVPACEEFGENVYMNPGSVSLPKGGSPRGYIVLDEDKFVWKTLEGEKYNEFSVLRRTEDDMSGILAESENYYILGNFENVSLYRKSDSKFITCVGDFYGDPHDAYIDPEERFCVTVGCGIIKYNLCEPFEKYMYDRNTPQWIETGREGDIEWCDRIDEVTDEYIAVSLEGGARKKFDINTLEPVQ
jgi:putative phosphoesterase